MNLDRFCLSENENERIKIAKAIIDDNPQIYSQKMIDDIKQVVRSYIDSSDEEQIDKYYLLSVYYYWAYGCSTGEFFMLDLLHKTHEQAKEYMTVHKKCFHRDHFNEKDDYYLLNDKYLAYQLLQEWYLRDVICIKDESDYGAFHDFVAKHSEFVVKPRSLMQGHGVFRASVDTTEESQIKQSFQDLLQTGVQYTEEFPEYHDTALVLEELIVQVPEMAKFHPQSINGVRINTFYDGEQVKVFKPWFKIGRAGEFVTSAIYGTFDAGIDPVTGIVCTPGASEKREFFEVHPDTGERILGFQVPKWSEAVELVSRAARKFDTLKLIGWDIVLTPRGWCIMEGNPNGGFMWELYEDKGSQQEIEAFLNFYLTKEFWWQEKG